MNQEVQNGVENEIVEVGGGIDEEVEGEESDMEQELSDDEYFEEIDAEMQEALIRNSEQLQLLHMSFNDLTLDIFDVKFLWFRRFFKEIEMINDAIEQIEEELFDSLD